MVIPIHFSPPYSEEQMPGKFESMPRLIGALMAIVATAAISRAQGLVERPLVTGHYGAVTSLEPLASMAGIKILMQGGNAFDAAAATAVAVAVVDPKNSSIGGQGFATIYIAKTGEVRALNFFGPAPKAATPEALRGKDYTQGYLSAPVPSNLKGYYMLQSTYGKLSWAQVLQPAIELAEQGFVVKKQDLTDRIAEFREELSKYPSSAKVFLPGGRVPQPGEIFVQKDLARTLKEVAAQGVDAFYKGDIAGRIADFYQQHGGLLTREDLADYQPRWVKPISTTYRGYTFYTQPPNSSAIAVLEQLNLLEGYDLKSMGHNTAGYLHLIGEVMRLAIADRNRYVGDPDFVHVPVDQLLSKDYARKRRALIDLNRTMPLATAGDTGPAPGPGNTTHMNVVDSEGNMVALTQTLGEWFGSGVVAADTGVLFSNQMRHLHLDPADPSCVEPGKRPRSNQSPIIVLKDGKPFMAIGTPGNDAIWQRLPQVIVNILDFGMDIQTAITEPRMIYGGHQETGSELKPIFKVEDRIPKDVVDALRAKGSEVQVVVGDEGHVNGIRKIPGTSFFEAGADPRGDTYAIAW
jgi:gamma-glutamyltranspeptidase / glutathione hydrolase